MNKISQLDTDWFLSLNGHHAAWLDPVMFLLTKTYLWLPLYACMLWLIYKKYDRKSMYLIVAAIALSVTLADRITSGIMKPYFLRPRPTHEPAIQHMVHTVNGYVGGQYGFASSHAANVFAVALLLWLLLRKHYRHSWLIFVWAVFVSYTRIYLGVHYPGDILAGALVGMLCGLAMFLVFKAIQKRVMQARRQAMSD